MSKIISLTEQPNYLTMNIDIATPEEMVRLFRQVDSQMLNGYLEFEGMLDTNFLKRFEFAINSCADIFKKYKKVKIILSGAGTSGRIAAFVSKTFNRILKNKKNKPYFDYLIAGGNKALVKAQEGAEDDPYQAVLELKEKESDAEKVIYVGITCGFSAPYIAGQMNYTLNNDKYFSILIGFNPVDYARNVPIENWNETFLTVIKKFEKGKNTAIINPIIGPEGITGSTRLKGGSATKILCEVLFNIALLKSNFITQDMLSENIDKNISEKNTISQALYLIELYEKARIETYKKITEISKLVKMGGKALRTGNHIYYIGKGNFGNLGTIDASECPPTFGAKFEDVRGFIYNGWKGLLEKDEDLSDVDWMYRISVKDFYKDIYPTLNKDDVVFFLGIGNDYEEYKKDIEKIKKSPAKVIPIFVNLTHKIDIEEKPLTLNLKYTGFVKEHHCFAELAIKFVLNLITTGAHIIKGKVYQNRMIDLNISNNKLFYRTINILQTLLKIDAETATESVLRSIYDTDTLSDRIINSPISKHIEIANGKEKVVPVAILLATGKFSIKEAKKALLEEPILRNIIKNFC